MKTLGIRVAGIVVTSLIVGALLASPAYADPALPLPRMPICGDQDGSETPVILRCPDFLISPDVQAYLVPGPVPLNLRFDFVFREAVFNNELGFFEVDGDDGRIDGLKPGEPGYIAAAFQRAEIIFPSGSTAFTPDLFRVVDGGDILVFFIVQDNTLTNLVANNPENELDKLPLAFFSLDILNPDGVDHFVGFNSATLDLTQFGFEDLTGGGDLDYDDIVYNIQPPLEPVTLCVEDAFEPDNGLAESTFIGVGETQDRSICSTAVADPFADENWVVISTEGGGTYVLETLNLQPNSIQPNADTVLTLTQILRTVEIGTNDNRGLAKGGVDLFRGSRITWHPPTDDLYFAKVEATGTIGGPDTRYQLRLVREDTFIVPDDQGTWAPTSVTPPLIVRTGNTFWIEQQFVWDAQSLANFKEIDAYFQWEFQRDKEYLDYWSPDFPDCKAGFYWSDLPEKAYSDRWTEETDTVLVPVPLSCMGKLFPFGRDEEFELKYYRPELLEAGRVYTVIVRLHRDVEDRDQDFFSYHTEAEFCGRLPFCRFIDTTGPIPILRTKFMFNGLIEGFTRP